MKIFKKLCIFVVIFALILGSPGIVNAAENESNIELTESKLAITTRITELENYLGQEYSGIYGLMFELRTLTEYSMYYQVLSKYSTEYNFTKKEEQFYRQHLAAYLISFNSKYSKKTTQITRPLELTLSNSDAEAYTKKQINSDIKQNVGSNIVEYYRKYLKYLQKNYDAKSTQTEKESFLTSNSTILSNLYKNLLVYQNVPNTLNSLIPTVDGNKVKYSIDGSANNKNVNDAITDICSTYKDLLKYGKTVAQTTLDESLEYDENESFLEIFSNTQKTEDGTFQFQDSVELSQIYLAMLSCSATYTPFRSYVGSSEFKSALKSLAADETEATALEKLYNNCKDYKKPLYHRTLDDNGAVTGAASLITIDDFLQDITSGSVGALVMIQGNFQYNSNEQSWIYADDELTYQNDSSGATFTVNPNNSETTTEVTTESTTESTTELTTESTWSDNSNIFSEPLEAKAETKTDTSSYYNLCNSIENTIFVGDQSVDYLQSAFINKGIDEDTLQKRGVYFISNSKASLSWLQDTKSGCAKEVQKVLDKDKDVHYTILFMIGNNDIGQVGWKNTVKNFASVLNKLASNAWKDHNIIVQSIGAHSESKAESITYTNNDVFKFNDELKSKLGQKVTFCDVTSNMVNSSGTELEDSYSVQSDGVTYDDNTVLKLCATSIDSVLDTNYSDNDAGYSSNVAESKSSTENSESELSTTVEDVGNTETINAVYAYNTITDESKMTQPVLYYGSKFQRTVDNMTTVLMQNIIQNTVNLDSIKNKSTRYLYMNAFGDIVTDDNLVIFPGYCNPLLYKADSAYNAYTVGVMNTYPSIISRSIYFKVASENDIGKYVLLANTDTENYQDSTISAYKITSNKSIDEVNSLAIKNIEPVFYVNTTDNTNIFGAQRCIFGSKSSWESSNVYQYSPLVMTNTTTIDDKVLFPYDVSSDTDYKLAGAIAMNAYQFIGFDRSINSYSNMGKLNDNYVLHNIVICGLQGTTNALGYMKDELLQYDQYVKGTNDRIAQQVIDSSSSIIDKTSDVDEVIGLSSSYENKILGTVLQFLRDNILIVLIIITLVLIIAFARYIRDLMEIILLGGASIALILGFVYVIPVYMTMFYNIVINNVCENLSYEVLGVKTEKYDADNTELVKVDTDGNFVYSSSSLTLYKVGWRQLKEFYAQMNVEESEVCAGKTSVLNQESGVYVEGDSIKIDTDILFNTLQIYGDYQYTNGNTVYQLSANKTVSNNIDYYIPFYQINDGFIEKLNTLASVYALPRSTITYADGKNKDNYFVYSYVNSPVFVNPGSYDTVFQDEAKSYISDYKGFKEEAESISTDLENAFGQNGDWLGIADLFMYLPSEYQSTLWAQTMQANGYYSKTWEPNEDKINDLIIYINRQTKNFVYDMDDVIGQLSDSTMIKLISLRAIIAFTQRTSDYGHWLYPFSLNYSEMSLKDVLQSVFTSDYSLYIDMNTDIATYIGVNHGWFNLIMFDIDVVLMFIIVNIFKLTIPILYLLFGVILILRVLDQGDIKIPFKGYVKTSLVLFLSYTLFDLSLVIVKKLNGSVWGIYIMFLVCSGIIYLIYLVLATILSNLMDFGNAKFNENFDRIFHFNGIQQTINNLRVSNMMKHDKADNNYSIMFDNDRLDSYQLDAPVDSFYDDQSVETVVNNETVVDDLRNYKDDGGNL